MWAGIRRQLGAQGRVAPRQTRLVLLDTMRAMVAALDVEQPLGKRDRALLLLGLAGGFRRSELISLDAYNVEETGDGLRIVLRRSKTDQDARGRVLGIPYGTQPQTCPVRALRAWLDVSGVTDGPLFRPIDRHGNVRPQRLSAQAVARIVRRTAEAAGLDPERFSGHSLRSGHVTAARRGGAPIEAIKPDGSPFGRDGECLHPRGRSFR